MHTYIHVEADTHAHTHARKDFQHRRYVWAPKPRLTTICLRFQTY